MTKPSLHKTPKVNPRPKLLIIDDEPDIRGVIRDTVESEFECSEASNGLEAAFLVNNEHFDLILTDFDMPLMNGFELIRHLHERSNGVPIIVLTGRGSEDLLRRATAFNTFDYIEKPFHPIKLLQTLKACLSCKWPVARGPSIGPAPARVLYDDIDLRISKEASAKLLALAEHQGVSMSAIIESLVLKNSG